MEYKIEIDTNKLKTAIKKQKHIVNKCDLNSPLGCLNFKAKFNTLTLIATDGNILVTDQLGQNLELNDASFEMLIDMNDLELLELHLKKTKMIDSVLVFDPDQKTVTINNEVTLNSSPWNYPNVMNLIPEKRTHKLGLSLPVLEKLVKTLKADKAKTVALEYETNNPSALKITLNGTDHVIFMPAELKGEN